jgi:lipopolysaccharide export system protein LptA
MKADTNVRSVVISQQQQQQQQNQKPVPPLPQPDGRAGRGAAQPAAQAATASRPASKTADVHMPAMLKQNEPVNVKSNRLTYDGTVSLATYNGNARLWQEDTTVQADTIVLDDKNGNLHATTGVRTVMSLKTNTAKDSSGKEPKNPPKDPKKPPAASTGQPTERNEPTTTVAEDLVYEDAKHLATYTTKAHMSGPDGDVTGDKIELYLSADGGQLDRAEAYGNVVSRRETRRAYGTHLTYLPDKDLYTMVGAPVQVFDDTPPDCKVTRGSTLTFEGTSSTIRAVGNGVAPATSQKITCGAAGLSQPL